MENKAKAIKEIKKRFDAKTREGIAESIIKICVLNIHSDQYIRTGLVEKTRSKKNPYLPTDLGMLFLEITKAGKAFNSIPTK